MLSKFRANKLKEVVIPTENEKKFVLRLGCDERIFQKLSQQQIKIYQGYLLSSKGASLRCRKTCNGKNSYFVTLKCSVNKRVVEIETAIDNRDFEDLWTLCMNKLEKIRYVIIDKYNQAWEVDFFKDHNSCTYFCLAELEMPEGQQDPKNIPKFIKENLVYEVPLTNDCRFASKLLADVRYSTNIYKELMESTNAEGLQSS